MCRKDGYANPTAAARLRVLTRRILVVGSVLLATVSRANADLQETLFRASDGTAYQVLSFTNIQGVGKFRVTTLAAGVNETFACSGGGGARGALVSAVAGTVLAYDQTLHPFAAVLRTAILTPNSTNTVSFAESGAGKVTIGSGGGALAICRVQTDCGGTGQTLVGLSATDAVGPACIGSNVSTGPDGCSGGNMPETYAFGPSMHLDPPVCTFPPTAASQVCAAQPTDGFDLQDGQAIVFVYDGGLATFPFTVSVGGFGIATDGTNIPGCSIGQVVTARARVDGKEPIPTPTPTGTATPTPTFGSFGVTGQIIYYSSALPVRDVSVPLDGPVPAASMTDASGSYGFSHIGGRTWQITPHKSGGVDGALSSLDAIYAIQFTLGLRTFTAEQRLAADVSGNGSITGFDAILILRRALGLIPRFPVAETCGSDWVFVPVPDGTQMVTQPQIQTGSCQPGAISLDPLSAQANGQDFEGIVFGDCTGNWNPQ